LADSATPSTNSLGRISGTNFRLEQRRYFGEHDSGEVVRLGSTTMRDDPEAMGAWEPSG
jgi:hypothetical protein